MPVFKFASSLKLFRILKRLDIKEVIRPTSQTAKPTFSMTASLPYKLETRFFIKSYFFGKNINDLFLREGKK